MEPEIVESREMLVAGAIYEGDNANQEIADLWSVFMPHIGEFKRADPDVTYGVCEMVPGLPPGSFRYVAGAEVVRVEDVPVDMTLILVPAGKYAVFEHRGALENLQKTYRYINQVWLPGSGYRRADRPDLEVYTQDFHDFQPDSILYLWVPVDPVL